MTDSDHLLRRAISRITEVERTQDVAPVLTPEALTDARQLLRAAAPTPGGTIMFDPVVVALWTFWYRAVAAGLNPDADADAQTAVSLHVFLSHELPDSAVLPELPPGLPIVEVDEQTRHMGFIVMVAGACALAAADALQRDARDEAEEALDQGLSWLSGVFAAISPDHDGYPDVACLLAALGMQRFEGFADPRGLALAVEAALGACRHVAADHPRHGPNLPQMLLVVVEGLWLLGYPELETAEELVRESGITALPITTARLEAARVLKSGIEAMADVRPEQRGALAALTMCEALVFHSEPPTLACGAARLSTALDAFPEGDHRRPAAVWLVHECFARLGWDASAFPEPDSGGHYYGTTLRLNALFAGAEDDFPPASDLAALVDRLLALGEELAADHGLPGLPAEVRAAIAFIDCFLGLGDSDPSDRPVERIARQRRALDALPRDHAARPAYTIILAATALERSQTLADRDPAGAAMLAAWADAAADEVAAGAGPDFEPVVWLRGGDSVSPLLTGLSLLPVPWSPESRTALAVIGSDALTATAEMIGNAGRTAAEQAGSTPRMIRALRNLARTGTDGGERVLADEVEDLEEVLTHFPADQARSGELRAAAGDLLAARISGLKLAELGQDTLAKVAGLLQRVVDTAPAPSELVATRLAEVWSVLGVLQMNPESLLRAEAAYEVTEAGGNEWRGASAAARFHVAFNRARTALHAYILTYEPNGLERVRAAIPELLELGRLAEAAAGTSPAQTPPGEQYQLAAEMLRDQANVVGPGGGPNNAIPDEVLVQCRATFAKAPAGIHRDNAASNLLGALISRHGVLRNTDPDGAALLLDEARSIAGSLAAEPYWSFVLDQLAQTAAGSGRRTGRPAADEAVRPPLPLPPGVPDHVAAPFLEAFRDLSAALAANPAGSPARRAEQTRVMREPAVPVFFRAHFGMFAALEAAGTYPGGVEPALEVGLETVGLLERLTDRGGSEQAAENVLSTFDGVVRQLATLVSYNVRIPAALVPPGDPRPLGDVFDHLAEQLGELARRYPEAAARFDGSKVLVRTVSGPHIDSLVALLERGRGLQLARRLESRADLAALRTARPALAARFAELTERLRPGDRPAAGRARLDGRLASAELDEVVEQIRAVPEFADFLAPLSPARLRELAAQGPIVVVNQADGFSCIAFVITADRIRALFLAEDVRAEDVAAAADRFGAAIEGCYARGGPRPAPSELKRLRADLDDVLSWTWHKIVEPVADLLGLLGPSDPPGSPDSGSPGDELPRLWWVPTGSFNALPLHAAQCRREGCAEGRCGSALDTVVSSYVPGLQTLAHTRARAVTGRTLRGEKALVVSETDDVLPGAPAAAHHVAATLGAEQVLIGAAATREAVLAALEDSRCVQFGCHAQSSPDLPAGSRIHLPGGEQLSVADIYRVRAESAALAVLTACGTARTTRRLTDEAVPVTSAFLLAGYPMAVGTLWEVESTHIQRFLTAFYDRACDDPASAARAVHAAVRSLREAFPDRPHVWAAYVHAGC